ncbi:transposable element Tc3 transposase [Elysia marginata]|uniref:Transposable element Tc3 transposase n=1 Tax=Elysia marginata TaxID=1093978 RepID=A0AAV4HSJ6_9GAST|nr:transposable element Tc3 transposase [Elysia marginata]
MKIASKLSSLKRVYFRDSQNRQNDVVCGRKKLDISLQQLYHETDRLSQKVMNSAGVCWSGKTEVVFLGTKQALRSSLMMDWACKNFNQSINWHETLKVNSKNYISLLKKKLLPSCQKLYPQGDFILQQGGATSLTSRATRKFLIDQGVDFIAKDEWPPQSPDLNPMDYAMWDSLAEVYMGQSIPLTVNELKAKIKESWRQISIEEVGKSSQHGAKELEILFSWKWKEVLQITLKTD